jgi:hypothetical protein
MLVLSSLMHLNIAVITILLSILEKCRSIQELNQLKILVEDRHRIEEALVLIPHQRRSIGANISASDPTAPPRSHSTSRHTPSSCTFVIIFIRIAKCGMKEDHSNCRMWKERRRTIVIRILSLPNPTPPTCQRVSPQLLVGNNHAASRHTKDHDQNQFCLRPFSFKCDTYF